MSARHDNRILVLRQTDHALLFLFVVDHRVGTFMHIFLSHSSEDSFDFERKTFDQNYLFLHLASVDISVAILEENTV